MRVVTNDKLIARNKQLAQILFFVSIAFLLGSFFFGNRIPPEFAVYFQCVLLPVMLVMVVTSVRLTNNWVRQPVPWDAIQKGLKGVSSDAVMYNYLMPANHVIVHPTGIFAITTRFQDAAQAVSDDKWKSKAGVLTYMRQEQLGNPTLDALNKAAQTEVFLQELLQDESIKVQPLIVFTHPNAEVTMEGVQTVPVLYANDKKKPSLKDHLRDAKKSEHPTLSKEQIAALDDVLLYEDA